MSTFTDTSLPLYQGIPLADVHLIRSAIDASNGELSTGPHLIQLATDDKAYLFPVTDQRTLEQLRTILESPQVIKVGFGLRDDLRRLQSKLGIGSVNIIDLAIVLRQEKRADVGAKAAVARFFGQRLQKSKKTSTTNWSNPVLTERQILYAANDAHVALRVYRSWCQAQLKCF